jgi:MoxR-like ATPase
MATITITTDNVASILNSGGFHELRRLCRIMDRDLFRAGMSKADMVSALAELPIDELQNAINDHQIKVSQGGKKARKARKRKDPIVDTDTTDDPTPIVPVVDDTSADPAPTGDPIGDAIAKVLQGRLKAGIDADAVREIVRDELSASADAGKVLSLATDGTVKATVQHMELQTAIACVAADIPAFLVGPPGSGKSTAGQQIADACGLDFYKKSCGMQTPLSEFIGYIPPNLQADAGGSWDVDRVREIPQLCTPLRLAYQFGGLFLFDEIDAANPAVVVAFNGILDGSDGYQFPDGYVKRHTSFRVIAGGNTYGTGANRQFVGRSTLDAASLDRFANIVWDLDPAIEASIVGATVKRKAQSFTALASADATAAGLRWYDAVKAARDCADANGMRHVISPRATIYGSRLLAAGLPLSKVFAMIVEKGADVDSARKLRESVGI